MKPLFFLSAAVLFSAADSAQFQITSFLRKGTLVLGNAFTNGVCTVERADHITGPWFAATNVFTADGTTQVTLSLAGTNGFFRALAVDLSNGREGFTNLVESYNLLTTIVGAGGTDAAVNKWRSEFEGGPATNALLSRPHIAMADRAGNIFIADKEAHAVRKVLSDGTIHTVAGINSPAMAPTNPALQSKLP
jgi:hypothetical protein